MKKTAKKSKFAVGGLALLRSRSTLANKYHVSGCYVRIKKLTPKFATIVVPNIHEEGGLPVVPTTNAYGTECSGIEFKLPVTDLKKYN